MKKSKIGLGIVAALASVTALASCSEVKATNSKEGYVLTYTNSSGQKINYTAEELFGSYYDSTSSISSMFDNPFILNLGNL